MDALRNAFTRSILVFTLLGASLAPRLAAAAPLDTNSCSWKGQSSASWGDPSNWNCSNGGTPQSDTDVTIDSGTPYSPAVASGAQAKSLTLNAARLSIGSSATVSVSGSTAANDGSVITLDGTLTSGIFDVWEGTTQVGGLGALSGPVDVHPLGTLQAIPHGTLTMNGDVTIEWSGTLKSTGDAIVFNGASFANEGAVNGPFLTFKHAGQQTISGSGSWTGTGPLTIDNGSHTTLANSVEFSGLSFQVIHSSQFALGGHTLNASSIQVNVWIGAAIPGDGLIQIKNSSIRNDGVISPTLRVISATTSAGGLGVFAGPIEVTGDAALSVSSYANVHAGNDVTITGQLLGSSNQFLFTGGRLLNNGVVAVPHVQFSGPQMTLQGRGYFSNTTTATVTGGALLRLVSDHQMSKVAVNPGGAFDLGGHALTLTMAGTPLSNAGVLTTTHSTLIYAGTLTQTLAYPKVDYDNLVLSNTVAVNAPAGSPVNLNITGDLTKNGPFNPFSSTLTFNGASDQAINGQAITFTNLVVSNTAGVHLNTNTFVQTALTLNGDLDTGLNTLTEPISATSTGDGDVWGSFKRTGPFTPTITYTLGSSHMTVRFAPTSTLPSDVTMLLFKLPPVGLGQAPWRIYSFEPALGLNYTATQQLHYRDSELGKVNETLLGPWVLDAQNKTWARQPRLALDTEHDGLQVGNVTGFSVWALAPISLYLPLVMR